MRRERDGEVAAAVRVGGAGARQREDRPRREALQVRARRAARRSRRRSCRSRPPDRHVVSAFRRNNSSTRAVRRQFAPHRHAIDDELAAVVALHEHADSPGVGAARPVAQCATRCRSRLSSRTRPCRCPRRRHPSSTAPALAPAIAAATWSRVTWRPRMSLRPPSFVSPTSALTDRTFSLPGCAGGPADDRVHGGADGQRIGEDDRRLDRPELLHLRRAGEFPERVADKHGAGDFLLEQVAAVREDRGHAGADLVTVGDGDRVRRGRRRRR